MSNYLLPYGRGHLELEVEDRYIKGVLCSSLDHYQVKGSQEEIIEWAMQNPICGETLSELAKGKKTATIIISDHTRPVPSQYIIPRMLKELRKSSEDIDITLLVATGCHRGTTRDELLEKLGEEIIKNEKIVIHNCEDTDSLVKIGTLPSGAELIINKVAAETELLISEGFIEPHFFAGFSGGRKSVLPGVCSKTTVLGNHCGQFIASPYARTGVLENNPIHQDMIAAAHIARLQYIVNVVLNSRKEVVAAFAGSPEQAHAQGCLFLNRWCRVKAKNADIVVTTNGGYPLDQNIYQSVKGMTAAEACVGEDGVIIIAAACNDGVGGDSFYYALKNCTSPQEILKEIEQIPMDKTCPDQWQYQILARILSKHTVILVSDCCIPSIITDMKMKYAATMEEAVSMAREIKGNDASFVIIPDGVSVIVTS
ncbi:nickel-dependent lactate racemase [Petroclostridium sp. X23]|uniref:nickel-dependent lactate racemase n=1 Tax=Petroclostridium sp. X23 TaxID=3045146 RepID=UPI0024AD34DF|nr:nickel-dependent lactate racemase [Petroclostridium sp. X23]WHH56810.1 nickel-dependent lactate racemase [Petroclostridium sp. X23]